MARRGGFRFGVAVRARQGTARRDKVRRFASRRSWIGEARLGESWCGGLRSGGQVPAGSGKDRRETSWKAVGVWRVASRQGGAGRSKKQSLFVVGRVSQSPYATEG